MHIYLHIIQIQMSNNPVFDNLFAQDLKLNTPKKKVCLKFILEGGGERLDGAKVLGGEAKCLGWLEFTLNPKI